MAPDRPARRAVPARAPSVAVRRVPPPLVWGCALNSCVAVQKTHEWRSAGPRPAAPRAMPA
eukprot:2047956-Prymnesium_polylepis.1